MSPCLVDILRVFVNTLTADDKYPFQDSENLPLPIELHLPKKQKTFLRFFVPFLESISNFKFFEKKNHCHSQCISEITDCESLRRPLSKKLGFRERFDSQHVKA